MATYLIARHSCCSFGGIGVVLGWWFWRVALRGFEICVTSYMVLWRLQGGSAAPGCTFLVFNALLALACWPFVSKNSKFKIVICKLRFPSTNVVQDKVIELGFCGVYINSPIEKVLCSELYYNMYMVAICRQLDCENEVRNPKSI